MAENQVQYNHQERKSDKPSDAAATATPKAEVEATDRGLFGFVGKKEAEKKCDGEGEVIASEFDEKVKVSEEKKEESKEHGSLLQKLHRSTSSSSSSSEEEVEEGGEKKKKKKEKKGLKEKCDDKPAQETEEEKKGLKEKCDDKPAQETEEKKGFLDKIKEKLPGGKKAEDVASPPPTPAPAAEGATSPGAEKKGFMDKIKERIPGYSKTGDEKEGAHH